MMRSVTFLAASLLITALSNPGPAASQPVSEMHQQSNQTADANGMFPARSTKGHFSVVMPVPFNDFTVRTPDKNIGELVMHMIGAKTTGGFEISAYEMERGARQNDPDLVEMAAGVAKIVGAPVPDIAVQTADDATFVETVFRGPAQSVHYKAAKTPASVFTVMCVDKNSAETMAGVGDQVCSNFVRSFRIMP